MQFYISSAHIVAYLILNTNDIYFIGCRTEDVSFVRLNSTTSTSRNGMDPSSNLTSQSKSPQKDGIFFENHANGRLTEAEKMEKGSIPWRTYHIYIKSAGGYILAFFVLLTFILNIFSTGKGSL